MQLGLMNRLRLISLLPIFAILLVASYKVYDSYTAYQTVQQLQDRLDQNIYLNDLIGNIARERGMSAMELGSKSGGIIKSLHEQRKIVDQKVDAYLKNSKGDKALHIHSNTSNKSECLACINVENIEASIEKIRAIRPLIDEGKIEFEEMFMNTYVVAQEKFIMQLEQITDNQIDKEINELYSLYISMVNAKESTGIERGYLAYIISRSAQLTEDDLNKWISIIGKADALNYKRMQNQDLVYKMDILFKNEESKELFEDINAERTAIISASESGEYEITSGIWFTMLSEKINTISNAEDLLLEAMDLRAKNVLGLLLLY